MRKLHERLKKIILSAVDFFYPPLRRLMPLQTFRYAVCGGCNTALGIVLYVIGFHYIFHKQVVHLPFIALSPYIAAEYLFSIWITFPIGFYLSRYIVFTEDGMKKRVQLFRYFLIVLGAVILKYVLLKLFIEVFGWYPSLSNMFAAVFIISFSYFSQRYFSFKKTAPLEGEV